jgi:opacity protein-like surface antigen
MMTMNKLNVCLLLLAVANVSFADDIVRVDPGKTVYVYTHTGEFRPEQNTGQLDNANGWYLEAGAGMFFNRYVSMQGGLWAGVHGAERQGSVLPDKASNDMTFLTTGIVTNVVLQIPIAWFRPYIGGGIGYYLTALQMDDRGTCLAACDDTTATEYAWGEQLMLGADFDITPGMAMTVSWQRLSLEDSFGRYTNGNIKLGGEAVGLGIKFKIN